MKKYNRVIALVLLLGICFPIINPISNLVYAQDTIEITQEDELVDLKDLLKEIDNLKENSENLTVKEFSEELLKIKENSENLDQDLLDKLELENSELLKELKSKTEELENILKAKSEPEPEPEPEETEETEKVEEDEIQKNNDKIVELKEEIQRILEELEELIKELNANETNDQDNKSISLKSKANKDNEEKLNDLKKQLDNDLSLDELENLKEEVTLFKTEIVEKLNDLDTKNSDQIVYIVTDQDEESTKEKYKDEFGDVIVTNHILKIFEEVRYDKTKYLTKEEAENKDLIVILEKDINFKEEVANAGYEPDWIDYKTLEIHDNLNSFKLIGKEKQRKIHFNFLTQSVKTEIDNINIDTSIVSGGYGHDADFTIKNAYINYIRGIDFSEKEHQSKKKSKININIKDSIIDEMIGVHGVDNKVADYSYEFDFNIKDSKVSKFLGCITLSPDGNYLDIAEKKVKIDYVNITSTNTDFQHFNGVLNAQGAAGMGAEVGDVNINLDNINVGKIEGMASSYPYNEGYMIAIMDSTNTMADYSFGDINFSMNKYSIEKALIPFIFTSMNPKEANVTINKIDLKLTDGGDKYMGKADHYIIGYLGMRKEIEEYKDLIHPINFNVAEGINVELEKVLASSVYLFNSYSEKNQTPKNMSINSDINIKIDDQGPGKGVYYVGLGANTGFNGDIVYNYGGNKYSNGNYFDMKSRKDPGNRFGEYLEENQSGGRTLIYNPENIVKGINAFTGKPDTLGVITGFKEIYLSTPLIIFGSNNLKQYAEGMKETKLYPLTPYKVENNSIVEDEWKLGDELIIVSPMAGEVPKDIFIQGWTENPPYNLDYFPAIREEIPSTWFLSINVTLHGNGGKFKNGEYDFYEIHVSDEGKKLEDYLQESDTDNYFELDGNGNIVLDNEGKPIDLKPVHPEGLEFLGWTISEDGNIEEDESKRKDFNKETIFEKNLHIYAKWKENDKPVEDKFTVDFNSNGGSKVESQKVKNKDKVTKPKDPIKDGYKFIGWYADEDLTNEFDFNTEITKNTRWSNTEISTLEKADVIKGYEDGKFKPEKSMTRAEIAAVLARFYDLTNINENQNKFKDTKGHWAEKYIISAEEKGLIKGYENGNFEPNREITRAEFVTIINRLLERNLQKTMLNENLKEFKDVNKPAWYYEDVLEAANGHEYVKENNIEKWTNFKVFDIN